MQTISRSDFVASDAKPPAPSLNLYDLEGNARSASDIDKVVLRIRKIPHIITTETMTAFTLS
jgi:hypothetical protein